MYFPTDRSETFAFPSLSVVTFLTTSPFSSWTSNSTPANTAPLSLSTFVISTLPLSTIAFSTVIGNMPSPATFTSNSFAFNWYPSGAFVSFKIYFPGANGLEIALPSLSVIICSTTTPSFTISNSAFANALPPFSESIFFNSI